MNSDKKSKHKSEKNRCISGGTQPASPFTGVAEYNG